MSVIFQGAGRNLFTGPNEGKDAKTGHVGLSHDHFISLGVEPSRRSRKMKPA